MGNCLWLSLQGNQSPLLWAASTFWTAASLSWGKGSTPGQEKICWHLKVRVIQSQYKYRRSFSGIHVCTLVAHNCATIPASMPKPARRCKSLRLSPQCKRRGSSRAIYICTYYGCKHLCTECVLSCASIMCCVVPKSVAILVPVQVIVSFPDSILTGEWG